MRRQWCLISLVCPIGCLQFVHTDDCATALIALMEHYDEAEFVSDIASEQWVTLQDVAHTITDYFEVRHTHLRAHVSECIATRSPVGSSSAIHLCDCSFVACRIEICPRAMPPSRVTRPSHAP
jgi:nucleoside-diphosphate-sugar epimerase